ncbi:MAG: hypothetical protein QGF21_08580 [Vicinamibacterales bacterium]|jgi:hypothetical protein|nr:hypothetical protein [Acidobacteriota bacterium]MDP7471400.1 hypothetical protein [Vicinamibacterales bacterium]MDP7671986.1 hypothetical protein [Vicinamibacterales bacterium]HJO37202.1 hypothetical protein [Vicinamibacterales bacterium]|tara:strand:- start:439 stop:657 length:219 start_codon:yes stop_codon:yes gene_type:complete
MASQPTTPIIVQLPDPPTPETTVADVLLQAIGLTGAFILIAFVAGIVIGGLLFRIRRSRRDAEDDGMQSLGL